MMTTYTKADRQKILDEFVGRHGRYDAEAFVREVQSTGERHPAWNWFEWDDNKAASDYRVWQARMFVQGLRVKFEVETIHRGVTKVVTMTAPAYVSPLSTRNLGGGYEQVDPRNEEHMRELRRQAAAALESFIERHGVALTSSGISIARYQRDIDTLRQHTTDRMVA
mgnify:CR=1 FL=1